MTLGGFTIRIILIELVDIQVACLALLKLATAFVDQMGFKFLSLHFLIRLAVGEDAMLDYDIRAVYFEMVLSLAQCIGHVAQMAFHLDIIDLVQNSSLHLDRLKNGVTATAVGAFHIWPDVLLAHHVVASFNRTADWVLEQLKAEAAGERVSCQLLIRG